jgi:hypothetical protein
MDTGLLARHSSTSSVGANEPRAPIAILSLAQRRALIVCLGAGTIHRRAGAWGPAVCVETEPRISGITVADLARDGLLIIEALGKSKSASLTTRGSWFARTVATSG